MAIPKKSSKKTETPKEEPEEQPKIDPEAPGKDLTDDNWARLLAVREEPRESPADAYIRDTYPWLERSQDIPRILKALLREVVGGGCANGR